MAELEIERYVEQLQAAVMSTVKVATTLGEMRDPYTAGHAAVAGLVLLTRDAKRYRDYFPRLKLVAPA